MARGPRRIPRTPVAGGYGETRIIQGKIVSVDKVKHTVDVQCEGNEDHVGIPFMARYVNTDGTGSFITPEVNMLVWVCTPSSAAQPFIIGASTPPLQPSSDDEDPNDFRMNRPVLNEGDEMVASRDSGYIIMRKGGMLEVAASQIAKTLWIPVENIIQSFCENYIIDTPGGSMSMLIRDEDETHGADKSPMEFKLNIKEFANDQFDIFDLRVGRIAAEDDTFIPIVGGTSEIVARLIINRHFIINVDKSGNMLRTLHGSEVENIEGSKFSTVHRTYQQIVRGLFSHVGKDRSTKLDGFDNLDVGTNRTVTIGGTLTEAIGAVTREVKGTISESSGSVSRTVSGKMDQSISGPYNEAVGGGKAQGVGENYSVNVGGKFSVNVANAQFPLEGTGLELVVSKGGEMHFVNVAGKTILASGGLAAVAIGRIILKPSGTVVLQNALGSVAEFELNASGIKLKTPAGDITLSQSGGVHLGLPGGGGVVTTLTHPFDYITGAPILGVSTVTANGIPAPGPGVPAVFIPDLS